MEKKFEELKTKLLEINDLNVAAGVLHWDQSTYMPPGGAETRGRQLATLSRLAHERSIDPTLGKLLDDLRPFAEAHPYDSDEAALIRVARRDYERNVNVPPELIAEIYEHGTKSYHVWAEAKTESDFGAVQPYLEKTVDISRQLADCFPGYEHIADPLIDFSDEGMTAQSIAALFADLRAQLVPLVDEVLSGPPADDSILKQHYPEEQQLDFGRVCIEDYGFDFQRGRQDKTHHPYMIRFAHGDVRITTRVDEHDLNNALFSTLHETGHAMYEQGIDPGLDGTPLGGGTSSGVHESQSRLWENIVGRSWGFWDHYYPQLQVVFPEQLVDVPQDQFYRAINKVQRSFIRTEADELTYNLHVMIRFDLELALLEGNLPIKDLPEAWGERYQSDLGIDVPDHSLGVMQDVHWFNGLVGGAFQGYTLGNIMSSAFYAAALEAHPDIPDQIQEGQFETLHRWLRENIYRYGRKFTANELVEKVTGGPLSIDPYIDYLKVKFG